MNRGQFGEHVAENFLREKNYHILAHNWRSGKSEIDLIAMEEDILVFVEVKTRSSAGYVSGYAAATKSRKKTALRRACLDFLAQHEGKYNTYRYDVIEILTPPQSNSLREILHYENVPLFEKEE